MAFLTGLSPVTDVADEDQVHIGRPSLGHPNDRRMSRQDFLKLGTTPGDVALNQNVIPGNISEVYTNEVLDPEDLTAANWVGVNGTTATLTGVSVKGHQLNKVTAAAAGTANHMENVTKYTFSNTQVIIHGIARRGNKDTTKVLLFDIDAATTVAQVNVISFDSQNIATTFGTLIKEKWIDDKTLEYWVLSEVTVPANDHEFRAAVNRIDGDNVIGDYVYHTAIQIIDDNTATAYPFVSGSKTADAIDKSFTMPGKGLHVWRGKPFFAYDTATNQGFFEWYVSGTQYLRCSYNQVTNTVRATWYDGGSAVSLDSSAFDDGSTLSVNQELLIMFYVNAVSGGLNDSLLVVLPLDSGAISSDNSWTGTPDVQSTDQPTLSYGHGAAGIIEANAECLYFRSYDWDGTLPTVPTSAEDADRLLAGLTPLFSATSSPTVDTDSITDETSTAVAIEKQAYTDQLMQDFDSWHYVGADNEPAFTNSWVNFGGSSEDVSFSKDSAGYVTLQGDAKSGTAGTSITPVPNGYRIDKAQTFPIDANGSYGNVTVNTDGTIVPLAGAGNTKISLTGIRYYAGF